MILNILLSAMLLTAGTTDDYRSAIELFDRGLYAPARASFEALPDDSLTDAYELLCALLLRSDDSDELFRSYERTYRNAPLSSRIRYTRAVNLFDDGRYPEAASLLSKVVDGELTPECASDLQFRRGYCAFAMGDYPEAMHRFEQLEKMPVSNFTGAARYSMGFMKYSQGDFAKAAKWFELASQDSRFASVCSFYILECQFFLKNYDYVVANAATVMEEAPEQRTERIARLLSESYLVLGDNAKAREYYDKSYTSGRTRYDYFYGGSVLYAVGDYIGAIENYTKMQARTDSLGQIANYNLANSYLRTRNRVAALDSFKEAAMLSFDPELQEDAYMNYAKLAFDLNQDNSGFEGYIRKYSTSRRGEQIYGYMALAALNRKDYAAAVDAYDNIDELDSQMTGNYMKANFLRGVQLFNSGAFRDAVPCFRAASFYLPKYDRFNQLSRFWLAECYYRMSNFSEAEKIYSELYNISALQGMDEGSIIPYNLGYALYSRGDYTAASRWFLIYAESAGSVHRGDALLRKADCDFYLRDYKAAVSSYQTLIDMEYGGLYPYYQQAVSYGLAGDRNSKVKTLALAAGADPSEPMFDDVLYELGRTYADLKKTREALTAFHKLHETTTNPVFAAKALLGLGMVNRNAKALDRALEYYKEVVSLMPGSQYADDALLAIESIYQTKKQPHKYLEYVESNKLIQPHDASSRQTLYFNTAEQLYLAGDWNQALVSLNSYLEQYPSGEGVSKATFYIAECYRQTGAKEQACDWYRKVMDQGAEESFAESATVHYASLSFELEHFQDAYSGYSKLLQTAHFDSNKDLARVGMMRSAFRSRNYDQAIDAASAIEARTESGSELIREARYTRAKSFLSSSRRQQAMEVMKLLAAEPSTPEGAEARYLLIQDMQERADYAGVEKAVYDFVEDSGSQSYWLAKAFITLADSFASRSMTDQAIATLESVRDGYEAPEEGDDIQQEVEQRLQSLK